MMKVIIVDDEPPARARLRALLRDEEVEIIAECGDGDAAVEAILTQEPDLVFLDIQMPGKNGFEVLQELPESPRTGVIFVTGYDEFAIRAFEVQALDYLLKPFSRERLHSSLERVRKIPQGEDADPARRIAQLLSSLSPQLRQSYPTRLVIKDGGKTSIVPISEVTCLLAEGNYVEVCTIAGHRLLLRETMQSLNARLDPGIFFRANRSALVNLTHLKNIESGGKSGNTLTLADSTKVHLTASMEELQRKLLSPHLR